MLDGPLDKPPLSIYTSALAMHFTASYVLDNGVIDVPVKQGEFASKLPNIFAGLLSIVLVFDISKRLFSTHLALFATLLMSISPYAVAYSGSAFTDALMLMFMLASWRSAVNQRPAWSGIWLALSFATKPQGVLYLPIVVAFILFDLSALRRDHLRFHTNYPSRLLRFTVTLVLGIGILLLWDTIRPETSLFTLGSINISQGRIFTPPDEWLPRLEIWVMLGDNLFGTALFTLMVVIIGSIMAGFRRNLISTVILMMSIGFFIIHWIPAAWTFDRYLLPLVPLFALLAGRAISIIIATSPFRSRYRTAIIAGIVVSIIANMGTIHDPRADAFRGNSENALIDLASYLNGQHLGAIVYDRWMGWEMGYYMGAWSDKRRVYYPDAVAQANDALLNTDPAKRYFVTPENRDGLTWIRQFQRVGFTACIGYMQDGFTVFILTPPFQVGLADYLPGTPQVWDDASVGSFSPDPVWCDDVTAS